MSIWELYEDAPEHGAAVADLDKAWQEAIALLPTEPSTTRALAAEKHMDKALQRWSHVGAYDTEPMAVVRWRVRKHFGCNGGWF